MLNNDLLLMNNTLSRIGMQYGVCESIELRRLNYSFRI